MDYSDIEILLKQSIGLDAAAIGSSIIERAVRQRVQACCLQDWKEYAGRILSSETELQSLIEAVVVPETWFFRDKTALTAMVSILRRRRRPGHPTGPLRLLSAPCSSGEEPYSMAMALLDAAFPLDQLQIEGWDISSQALARARTAVYGRNSFRGPDIAFRQRHFERATEGHRVKASVRRVVSFAQANLLSADLPAKAPAYDVVFCRNLLIYLDRPAQERVLHLMHQLLTTEGVLFVSPAEGSLISRHGFTPAGLSKSFAFRKKKPVEPSTRPKKAPGPFETGPARWPAAPAPSSFVSAPKSSVTAATARTPDPAQVNFASRLELAQHLADRGHLLEAGRLCEQYLRTHGDSVEAYYLLALVKEAAGDERTASQCYRKVLYLDPQHARALLQLALLTERQGDPEGARLLHERARRVQDDLQP